MFAPGDIPAIHQTALVVLARTGVLVREPDAVELLSSHGLRADGARVFFDEDAVSAALAAAPSSFTLAGRRPELDLHFGGPGGDGAGEGRGTTVFATASGSAFVLDGDELRPGRLGDARRVAKLVHALPDIQLSADCIEPVDLPEELRTRRCTQARLTLSDKAIEWIASVDDDLDVAVALNEILYGAEWARRPRALIVLNTNSPLQLSGETARLLVRWARLGQPSCVTACVMGGTTGPATPAGTLVVQHAEVLAALVLAQAAAEGSPFIYGGLSAMSSMRTGAVLFGTLEFALLADATARLAHHAGLPVRAGAAVTDAHVPDAQAALESFLGLSAGANAGADFMLQAAGSLSSFNVLSLEKLVMDVEAISMLRALASPARVDADSLAADVIDAAGPAGDYLGQAHTRRHVRDLDRRTFLVREASERWRSRSEADVRAAAAREVDRLLAAHEPPDDLDALVRRQIDEYCLG
jgi:trimethylamine---corrinoid protein Co-methyltransferase